MHMWAPPPSAVGFVFNTNFGNYPILAIFLPPPPAPYVSPNFTQPYPMSPKNRLRDSSSGSQLPPTPTPV
jgi:hypothetical protein